MPGAVDEPSDLSRFMWRKSGRSGSGGGACVEVGLGSSTTGVRDSKDLEGPELWFNAGAWSGFLDVVKRGELG